MAAVAALALVAAPASVAHAYVRYTSNGLAFAWGQSCVAITAYPADFVNMMPLEEVMTAANAAAAAWSKLSDPCSSYLSLSMSYSMDTPPGAVNDHRNSLLFRTTEWCDLLPNGQCDPKAGVYDPAALAVTTVRASTTTGEIRDADIEVNAVSPRKWGDLELHTDLGNGYQDLQNALTHEVGHLIGLDHSCYQPELGLAHPLDNTGAPAPECAQAPQEIRDSTMYPSADPGDISKRTLDPDDQMAVCDIYPADKDPMVCSPNDGGGSSGCSCDAGAGGAGAGSGGCGLLLAAAALLTRRARRVRRA